MDDYFSNLDDTDFFSNKLTHIYFTEIVSHESIDKLINNIKNANNIQNPKPILIHICSSGGDLKAGLRLLTIFKISKVPIATMIDNYSCSAATFLSINSPYRIMNKYGFCLLHEYSIIGTVQYKRDSFVNSFREIENYFNIIIDVYLKKSKYTRDELLSLLQHNLYLDYKTCLSKGIVDRVIDIKTNNINNINTNIDINNLINNNIKTIQLPLSCDIFTSNIDMSIITSNITNIKTPYLIYPVHEDCYNMTKNNNLISIENILTQKNIFKTLNIIPRISNILNLKIGIIDTPISIDNILPLLFTDKIYMYKHTFIICNLLYFYNMNNSILLDDNVKNTKLLMTTIKSILKKKTKMKISDIKLLNQKFLIIDSNTALKWGLCHEIIET